MTRLRYVTVLLGLLTLVSQAHPATVETSVSTNPVRVGQQTILTLRVQGEGISSPRPPRLPSQGGVQVSAAGRVSSSTSISIVNGKMTRETSHTVRWTIRFTKPGTYRVPAIGVQTPDGVVYSNPITIRGVAAGTRGREPKKAFLKIRLSESEVVLGQTFTATYTLFVQGQPNARVDRQPTFTGFWSEVSYDATKTQTIEQDRTVINGIAYNVIPILRVLLIPTTTGTLEVDALHMQVTIQTPTGRRNFWGQTAYRSEALSLASPSSSIVVKPLPSGAPSGFSGAVGRYNLSAVADKVDVTQGDPVTLRITLSGEGNIKTAGNPIKPHMTDFQVYDPVITSNVKVSGGRMTGKRSFEYVLIPENAGRSVISPFVFSYFDPERGVYDVARSQRIDLTVAPRAGGDDQRSQVSFGLSQRQIEQVGSDINYIKPNTSMLRDYRWRIWDLPGYWWWHLVPLLGLAATWGVRIRSEKQSQNVGRTRSSRAVKEARARLKSAKKLLKSGQRAEFYRQIGRTITSFVADQTNRAPAGLTTPHVIEALTEDNVPTELVNEAADILGRCDQALFAQAGGDLQQEQEVFDRAVILISSLSRATRGQVQP